MNQKLIIRAANKFLEFFSKYSHEIEDGELNSVLDMSYVQRRQEKANRLSKVIVAIIKSKQRITSTSCVKQLFENVLSPCVDDISWKMDNIKNRMSHVLSLGGKNKLSLKHVMEEISAIVSDRGADNVTYKNGQLSVIISDVELTDGDREFNFGNMRIVLDLTKSMLSFLSVEATYPICSNKGYFHPHVNSSGSLCQGEGDEMIEQAVLSGRLEDLFTIVESILRTYNSSSPYDELCSWYNPSHEGEIFCDGCENYRPEDDMSICVECGDTLCSSCAEEWHRQCIDCDNMVCDSCASQCGECNETLCDSCMSKCGSCGTGTCSECRVECSTCGRNTCLGCAENCEKCENIVCSDCRVVCSSCDVVYCEDCSELSECSECGEIICPECASTCETCLKILCSSCKTKCCDNCNRELCTDCYNLDSGCLLKETINE